MQTMSNGIKAPPVVLAVAIPLVGTFLAARWLWVVLCASTVPLRRGTPIDADEALLACVAALALATLVWLLLGMVLETLARVPGELGRAATRISAAVSPLVVRRTAAVVLGAGLSVALSPGASMASAGASLASLVGVSASPTPGTSGASSQSGPTGNTSARGLGSLPDPGFAPRPDAGSGPPVAPRLPPPLSDGPFVAEKPVVRAHPDVRVLAPSDRRRAERSPVRDVVVHRGDSLWSIASRHLGRGCSDAEIASEWPRWYEANAAVIGSDPDLLLPGQVLNAPEGSRP